MNVSDLEITVKGANPTQAGDAVALGLMAAGATIDFPARAHWDAYKGGTLHGRRATIRLASVGNDAGAAEAQRGVVGLAFAAKLGIGALLMLMLVGAEVKLHFGPRLDTVVTLVGIWSFWRWCRRSGDAIP